MNAYTVHVVPARTMQLLESGALYSKPLPPLPLNFEPHVPPNFLNLSVHFLYPPVTLYTLEPATPPSPQCSPDPLAYPAPLSPLSPLT